MFDKITTLIQEYETPGDFTYAVVDDSKIAECENKLNIKLPAEYIDFIKNYGQGGICGVEIFGIAKNGECTLATETLEYRKYGLPDNLLVIENCDEWVYCIDCSNNNIVSWSPDDCETEYESFNEYLLDSFSEATDNWEG